MKKFLLFVCFIAFSFSIGYSQKVKLTDIKVKAQYLSLPRIGMPVGATSYYVNVTSDESSLNDLGYTIAQIKDLVNIPGYIKSDQPVGVKIDIDLKSPTGDPLKLKKDAKESKDGKKWTEYSYMVTFRTNAKISVIDEKGNLLKDYAMPKTLTKQTGKYRSSAELKKKFNSSKFYISGRKEALQEILKTVRLDILYDYGLDQKTDKVEFSTLKTDKHRDFRAFEKIKPAIVKAFENMSYGSNASFLTDIQPAIDFWLEKEPTYSEKDKQQKKLKWAVRYNLAKAYFWAEDLENAKKYATLVQSGSYKSRTGKRYLKKIKSLQEKMDKVKIDSRHFTIELSEEDKQKQAAAQLAKENAIASGDIQAFPDFNGKLEVKNNSQIKKGKTYHSGGAVLEGYYVYENGDDYQPNFMTPKNIRFGYLKDNAIAVGTIKYAGLDSIYIDTTMYIIEDVVVGSGLTKLKLDNAIVETLYTNKASSIKIIHPPFANGTVRGNTASLEPQLVVYKKTDEKYHATTGILGFHKAMTKIVKGCQPAIDYLTSVKNEKSKKSLLKRALGFDNIPHVVKAMEIFDTCK